MKCFYSYESPINQDAYFFGETNVVCPENGPFLKVVIDKSLTEKSANAAVANFSRS